MPKKNTQTSLNTANNKNIFTTYLGKLHKQKDGSGILVDSEKGIELPLASRDLQYVWEGDTIILQIGEHGAIHNIEIKQRGITHILGKVIQQGKYWNLIPENNKLPEMYITKESIKHYDLKKDNIIYAKILTYPDAQNKIGIVEIKEVMGKFDDAGIEIDMAVKKYNLPHEFSVKIEKELQKIPNIPDKQDYKDRINLTDIDFVTIDGEDARDFDDAVYCEPCNISNQKQNNAWRLLVAIADVSHYVKPNTKLDAQALTRATSVYFPRKVIPMLPEKLSNGLCSLNPNVDRLCMVCDMVIDNEGNITAYQFYNAIIHSKARLTYNIVFDLLQKQNLIISLENKKAKKIIVDKQYSNILPTINNLYYVYQSLLASRLKRGAIDFDTEETQIICSENGKIEKIIPRTRNEAHKLIEECMLAANVCAATFIQNSKHNSLYRIHDKPNKDKLLQLQKSLQILGIKLHLDKEQQTSTKNIANVLHIIQSRPDSKILQNTILRSMQQAIYTNGNIGHYGLAYTAYTHFTSPIRRYPDLLVHRTIKAILEHKNYMPAIPSEVEMHILPNKNLSQKNAVNKNKISSSDSEKNKPTLNTNSKKNIWNILGSHCSALERRADEASRDVEAWLKCYFMQSKIGYEYKGFVSGVVPFGLFIQLQDLYVDGLLHVSDLGKDYFIYDEVKQEMYGKQSHKRYKIGDEVLIKVAKVDISTRKIDFSLIKNIK